jgi:hypothetical protein
MELLNELGLPWEIEVDTPLAFDHQE